MPDPNATAWPYLEAWVLRWLMAGAVVVASSGDGTTTLELPTQGRRMIVSGPHWHAAKARWDAGERPTAPPRDAVAPPPRNGYRPAAPAGGRKRAS